jgi:PhnB protein
MPTKAPKHIPEGMNTITTELWYNGNCMQAVEFYKKAFGAETIGEISKAPDGKSVIHAMLKIGNSNIMMADVWPGNYETGPVNTATAGLFLYVEDCDKLYNQALKAGCMVVNEMVDAFWGDRMGKVKDPYGHCWSIATFKWVLTREEINKGMEDWMKSAATN